MTRSRQTNQDSQHGSDSSEEDTEERYPNRGRTGQSDKAAQQMDAQVDAQINAMMDENSKASGAWSESRPRDLLLLFWPQGVAMDFRL